MLIYTGKVCSKTLFKTACNSNNVCVCLGYHEWRNTNRIGTSCVASLKVANACSNIVAVSSNSTCGLALRSPIQAKCAPKPYAKLFDTTIIFVHALADMSDVTWIVLVLLVLRHLRWLMHELGAGDNVSVCLGYYEWHNKHKIGSTCVRSLKVAKALHSQIIVTVSSSSSCG
jgi:hypothetical protein